MEVGSTRRSGGEEGAGGSAPAGPLAPDSGRPTCTRPKGPEAPRSLADYWAEVRRWHRYNVTVHVLEGVSTYFGLTYFDPATVLVVYVGLLTSSKLLMNLPWALITFSWAFPQLFFSYYLQRARQRRALAVVGNVFNRIPLLLVALSALLAPRLGTHVALVSLFLLLSVNVIFNGIGYITWQDLLGRIIAPERRGAFFGLKQCIGMSAAAVSAVSMGVLLRWLGEEKPQSYGVPFLVGAGLYVFSIFLVALSHEPSYPRQREPVRNWWRYTRGAFGLLATNRNFTRYLVVRALFPCASLFSLSLYSAYAREAFAISPSKVVAALTAANYLSQVLVGPWAGRLGDRLGFKSLLVVSAGVTATSLVVGLSLPLWGGAAIVGFTLVSFLFGVSWLTMTIANLNIVLEFAHVEDRPAYMGLAATLGAPTLLLAPLLGGWLVDRVGYVPVMAASLAVSLLVAAISALGFREPRETHDDLEGLGLRKASGAEVAGEAGSLA